jgi:glycopeptide antibiotics resistance protein
MRGFSEVDDVMHNTIGCIAGYIMVKGSRLMVKG